MHGDNTAAIDWAKFGKITVANKHIALAYHEQREWVNDGFMWPMKTPTKVNNSDQCCCDGGVCEIAAASHIE